MTTTKPSRVAVIPRLAPDVLEIGRSLAPRDVEVTVVDPADARPAVLDAIAGSEFIMGFPWRMAEEEFEAARTGVRLIQLLSAGFDDLDVRLADRYGIPVATNGGANATAVAEHTVLSILAVYRHLVDLANDVREGRWQQSVTTTRPSYELEGKVVGLVGMGHIGRAVASRLRAFGAEVIYSDPRRLSPAVELGLGVARCDLDTLVAEANVVSLHLPLNPQTRGIIDRDRLAAMKPSSVLVNTARGDVVDEEALAEALTQGRIFGAAVDALSTEPPPPDHPLLGLPNCLVTPHSAGPTWDSWRKRFCNGYANIERVREGRPAQWVVAGPRSRRTFQ